MDELWRHTEQRGYYTRLQQGANLVLREMGLEHSDLFGAGEFLPADLAEPGFAGVDAELLTSAAAFDCIELFSGEGNWSRCHAECGFSMHPGLDKTGVGIKYGDLLDDGTFRAVAALAANGSVEEWHAAPPCWSFGTLRRPRLRSLLSPYGFAPWDPKTLEQTKLAFRAAFILMLALLAGCYISCEQPGSSVMFLLEAFRRLLERGCVITKMAFCSYGAGFMKPSKWLRNKPWLMNLASSCSCPYKYKHFTIEGSFTRSAIEVFKKRCRPSCKEVYGRDPRRGEAVSAFSASYPLPLCRKMAEGSWAARRGSTSGSGQTAARVRPGVDAGSRDDSCSRPWFEDPDWVGDLCETLRYRELFRYRFKQSNHINVLECRVYKSWLKHCAKQWGGHRLLALLDSRVTMGAASKGRSSSPTLSRVLRSSLGYILGGGLFPGALHCRSAWNRADGPSRDTDVPPPSAPKAQWIADLERGDVTLFDIIANSSQWTRPVGRWVRLLLLLAGDIETNPGPAREYEPRGELNLFGGLTQPTSSRMQACLDAFSVWLQEQAEMKLEDALSDAESCNLALSAYGKFLFSAGKPRYLLVYCITAVQRLRPQFRNHLGLAWHVDRMWQLEQPGQCRAVLSAPMLRAALSLSLLWKWYRFAGVVALGFMGMLHPNEFLLLLREDLVFPEDALTTKSVLYIHIRQPKTARFARRQHARVDDDPIILLARCVFGHLPRSERLYPGSVATFRRQWNHLFDYLQVPRKQNDRGIAPGTLRGSGATEMYLASEDLPRIAWRGRWARMRTLERYVQEVGAQLFMHRLNPAARELIQKLQGSCLEILAADFPQIVFAKQNTRSG